MIGDVGPGCHFICVDLKLASYDSFTTTLNLISWQRQHHSNGISEGIRIMCVILVVYARA